MKLANAQGPKALFCSEAPKALQEMLTVGTGNNIQQCSGLFSSWLSAQQEGIPSVSRSAKMESSSTPALLSAWEVEAALPLLILAFSMSATSASCRRGVSSVVIATLVVC